MAEADNIMNKLSEVLNDPQTMTQINQIMSSLSGGSANEAQEQSDESSTAPDISSMLSRHLCRRSKPLLRLLAIQALT